MLRTFEAGANVSDVAWSPDGDLLAIGACWGGGVQIYSVATGERVVTREEPDQSRVRVSWRPDGRQLAVNTSGHWYILGRPDWNIVLEHAHPFAGTSDSTGGDIAWNEAGTQLAFSEGTTVIIWDPLDDRPITKLVGHVQPVGSVSWSRDGHRLLTADGRREIKIWNLQGFLQPPPIATGAAIELLCWEADSKHVVSVSKVDLATSIWNARDGRQVSTAQPTVEAAEKAVRKLSPDGRLVAISSPPEANGAITVREAVSGAVHSIWRSGDSYGPLDFAWSPDGLKLAITTVGDNDIRLDCWDANDEELVSRWTKTKCHPNDSDLYMPTWSSDASRVAVVGNGDRAEGGGQWWTSHVHVIDVASGKRAVKHALGNWMRLGGKISALEFSPDAHLIALGGSEGLIRVVDIDAQNEVMVCKAHEAPVTAIDWSPDESRLAAAAADGTVRLVDMNHGTELLMLQVPKDGTLLVKWSPDGKRLAAATDDGMIHIWDANRGYQFEEGGARYAELAWAYYGNYRTSIDASSHDAMRKALEIAPEYLDFRLLRGSAFARLGQFDEAAREFRSAQSQQFELGFQMADLRAYALLGARDQDAYRELVAEFANKSRAGHWGHWGGYRSEIAWLGVLLPGVVDSFPDELKSLAARRMGALDDESPQFDPDKSSARLLDAAMMYRLGNNQGAADKLMVLAANLTPLEEPGQRHYLALTHLLLAMARHELGHEFQAQRSLAKAIEIEETLSNLHWSARAEFDTLRREAESLIEP